MKKRGFTLIELLVVIAIIGILSSVVVASLNTARKKARDAKRLSDIKQIQLALEMYNDKNGSYPNVADTANLVNTGFLPTLPADPSTNAAYAYAGLGSGATCTSYHLGATLEDASNVALNSDKDAAAGTKCTGSADDFDGTVATVYDVIP